MEAQDLNQDQDGLAGEVMEHVGMSKEDNHEETHSVQDIGDQEDLPKGVKERLGRQEKRHQKEMRHMRAQLEAMQNHMNQSQQVHNTNQTSNSYVPPSEGGNIEEHIHKAVSYALQHREMEERKAKEVEHAAHIHRQYKGLQSHLDDMADKYDDFHDVVLGEDAPFTTHMRDFAMTLPKDGSGSAGEVLYKLGKNPEELNRISKLHPIDQASEMVKLSHALMGGYDNKSHQPRPIGQIKSNPVTNSHNVTDKTPVSELRRRMRAGWK